MTRTRIAPLAALVVLAAAPFEAGAAPASASKPARTLDDYRHYRALSIDLLGRAPTREEVAAFEAPSFDVDGWIGAHLDGDGYVDRLTRIYMDALRLEVSPAFMFNPPSTTLRRVEIKGPKGPLYVYYRVGQRRAPMEIDGEFCLSPKETGLQFPLNRTPVGSAIEVSQKLLDERTVAVKPWWLYRDYRTATPVLRFDATWTNADPIYRPVDTLLKDADGSPTTEVRVCKEEAQKADNGTLYASGRDKPIPKGKVPGRLTNVPADDAYVKKHAGEAISCRTSAGVQSSIDCGCGVGLEHCMPGDSNANESRAFTFPARMPLGFETPLSAQPQSESSWHKLWWSQEAARFFYHLFRDDHDFREVLTAKWTYVNGPLAQFYRSTAPATCCGQAKSFGLLEETEPLFDPKGVPTGLQPSDVSVWEKVDDRGPRASGILTMPIFLTKFASRRARGAALYSAFACKSFVADKVMLQPSTEPDLTKRQGCSTCHATLEPLAAYFSRVVETDWTYLPKDLFAIQDDKCKLNAQGKMPGFCLPYYDPAFADSSHATLRGAYASSAHADAGPAGAAADFVASPDFATCAVDRVASSFLGRPTGSDDAAALAAWTKTFTDNGYRMRALVRAILESPAYAKANNVGSDTWRGEQ